MKKAKVLQALPGQRSPYVKQKCEQDQIKSRNQIPEYQPKIRSLKSEKWATVPGTASSFGLEVSISDWIRLKEKY